MRSARLVICAVLLCAAAASAKSHPTKKTPTPSATTTAATGERAEAIELRIIEQGQLMELQVQGDHLRIRTTAGGAPTERTLLPVERARLSHVATAAVHEDDTRRGCGDNETFIAVTVDGATNSSAVCPSSSPTYAAPWRALIVTARAIATQTALTPDGGSR